jgi:hypothetical protein
MFCLFIALLDRCLLFRKPRKFYQKRQVASPVYDQSEFNKTTGQKVSKSNILKTHGSNPEVGSAWRETIGLDQV